jgi:hypothetical protein
MQARRIDAGKDVANGAVLTGRIERLENEQHGVAAVRVEAMLRLA